MRTPGLLVALLIGVTAALYASTVRYPPVYEDLNDPGRYERALFVPALANPSRWVPEMLTDVGRVLTPQSFAGQHALSVSLHLLNIGLLWLLARRVLPESGAIAAVGVFALWPMQAEAVTYVAARADLVAATGVLLALWATTRGSLAGALGGCVLASLSKESALLAWAVVPLWALVTSAAFPLRRFLLIGAVLAGIALWRIRWVIWLSGVSLDPVQIGHTATAMLGLTALTAVPTWLSIDHDWRGVSVLWQALSVGLVVSLTVAAIYQWRRWVSFAWLAVVLWCLPRFLVHNSEGMHEHHWVVPMIGWSLSVGGWLSSTPYARV